MNDAILNIENQEFINNNLNIDINILLLKNKSFNNVTSKQLVEQIEAKKKCQLKLPTWFKTANIYYPNKLNIEQTSSEIAAKYKANLISGNSLIDLTGGFGVDTFYFSKQFKNVTHCEVSQELSKIVTYNFKQLNINSIKTVVGDGIQYLITNNKIFDWIYLDPSRRHDSKGKVFYLKDCLPNVPEHLSTLFKYSNNILIKVSPMLDLSIGILELKYVKKIHVVAVKNEVKELLFHLEKAYSGNIEIKTINIKSSKTQILNSNLEDLKNANANYGSILNYLYEPNSAILKSGAFNLISEKLKVTKLQQHTHLYTSDNLIDFPGRVFRVLEIIPYHKKNITKRIGNKKVNLSTRNFPESITKIKEKFKLKDGGDTYAFFTTQFDDKKVVVVCEKVSF